MDFELLYSWFPSAILLVLLFYALKQYEQHAIVRVLRILTIILLCFHLLVICSLFLHEIVLYVFDVNTHGFMNLNSILIYLVIWCVMALALLFSLPPFKELFASFYKPIKITLLTLLALPILAFLLFYIAVAFKV